MPLNKETQSKQNSPNILNNPHNKLFNLCVVGGGELYACMDFRTAKL